MAMTTRLDGADGSLALGSLTLKWKGSMVMSLANLSRDVSRSRTVTVSLRSLTGHHPAAIHESAGPAQSHRVPALH